MHHDGIKFCLGRIVKYYIVGIEPVYNGVFYLQIISVLDAKQVHLLLTNYFVCANPFSKSSFNGSMKFKMKITLLQTPGQLTMMHSSFQYIQN